MTKTILPKKAVIEKPMALGDEHHEQLVADPNIKQFTQDTSFGGSFGGSFTSSPDSSADSGFTPVSNLGSPMASNNNNNTSAESLKNTGGAMQEGAESLVKNDNTDWINKKWRPAMGWIYMLTCTCDFVLFPVLWSLLQALSKGQVTNQWQPLTLQGAGLYHIAMGAVLGIAAYGRTKEKIEGAAK
jgi:hypothetical protein